MKWVLLVVALLVVGCGKGVPVENPSMTYLEASKIVEDEEKELAKWTAKKDELLKDRDIELEAIAAMKLSPEDREAKRKVAMDGYIEMSTKISKLIVLKTGDIERAKADRDALRSK